VDEEDEARVDLKREVESNEGQACESSLINECECNKSYSENFEKNKIYFSLHIVCDDEVLVIELMAVFRYE
jgi:hypothetical protein